MKFFVYKKLRLTFSPLTFHSLWNHPKNTTNQKLCLFRIGTVFKKSTSKKKFPGRKFFKILRVWVYLEENYGGGKTDRTETDRTGLERYCNRIRTDNCCDDIVHLSKNTFTSFPHCRFWEFGWIWRGRGELWRREGRPKTETDRTGALQRK